MNGRVCTLAVNTSIEILRSNGRVHSAIISAVNLYTGTVTVEWDEAGENKGKEIEFEEVYSLNPDLQQLEIPSAVHSTKYPVQSVHTASATASSRIGRIARTSYLVGSKHGPPAFNQKTPAGKKAPILSTSTNNENVNPFKKAQGFHGNKQPSQLHQRSVNEKKNSKSVQESVLKEEKFADPSDPNCAFINMIIDFRHELEYCPLADGDPIEDHQITVAIRKRPLSAKEIANKEVDVVTIPQRDVLYVHEPKIKVDLTKFMENQKFRYDYVFNESSDNELVYKYTARPLVRSIFEGGMATCFAYGQTGSGKTHTMGGDFQDKVQDCTKGIYACAALDIFKILTGKKYKSHNLGVSVSFFEIYGAKVFDLLNQKNKLKVLEDGEQVVHVVGLSERICENSDDVMALISMGSQNRTSGQTAANLLSSRSHAVLQIILRDMNHQDFKGENRFKLHGKLSLIDLAGNERGADTKSNSRIARIEGAEINKSLLALKECIRALGRKGAHQPFRASKLTMVLKDSFAREKSKTCMIAMISPSALTCEHTLNTLRYADRVKELGSCDIKNASFAHAQKGEAGAKSIDCSLDSNEITYEDLHQSQLGSLQEAEEAVVEQHGLYFANRDSTDKDLISLYEKTNDVDYDLDAYSLKMLEIIERNVQFFEMMGTNVSKLKHHLSEEENTHQQQNSAQKDSKSLNNQG